MSQFGATAKNPPWVRTTGEFDKGFSGQDNNICYTLLKCKQQLNLQMNIFFTRLSDLVGVLDWRGLQSTLCDSGFK
jgi:hypothetical protein